MGLLKEKYLWIASKISFTILNLNLYTSHKKYKITKEFSYSINLFKFIANISKTDNLINLSLCLMAFSLSSK